MKLKPPFDELKDAVEQASYEHHCPADKKNHKSVFINEYEGGSIKKSLEIQFGEIDCDIRFKKFQKLTNILLIYRWLLSDYY